MGRLSADQREVLLLAAVEELRYEEIASVLQIPIGTVMSRLSRAREQAAAAGRRTGVDAARRQVSETSPSHELRDAHADPGSRHPRVRRRSARARRAAVVEAAIARDPELAARIAALRAQNAALRDALDPALAEPIPAHLLAAAVPPASRAARSGARLARRWPSRRRSSSASASAGSAATR